jgi:hypothetical protein
MGVFLWVTMEFHRLSAAFYAQFSQYEEILTKEERPYYVLLLSLFKSLAQGRKGAEKKVTVIFLLFHNHESCVILKLQESRYVDCPVN